VVFLDLENGNVGGNAALLMLVLCFPDVEVYVFVGNFDCFPSNPLGAKYANHFPKVALSAIKKGKLLLFSM